MMQKIKEGFFKALGSKHAWPIMDLACIFLSFMCFTMNYSEGKIGTALIWGLASFIDALSLYFYLSKE